MHLQVNMKIEQKTDVSILCLPIVAWDFCVNFFYLRDNQVNLFLHERDEGIIPYIVQTIKTVRVNALYNVKW